MASKPQVIQSMALSQLSELLHIHPWAINNLGNTMLIVLWFDSIGHLILVGITSPKTEAFRTIYLQLGIS